jgi:hypothetical protein
MNPTNLLPFFDPARPVFIKQDGVNLGNKVRKRGEHYDWQAFGESYQTMLILFNQDFIYHDPELEEKKFKEVAVKDLEEMTILELHLYIDNLNQKLRPKLKNNKEFSLKKCPKVPKDTELQVRKIKNWRLTFGHLLD